ncbi:MAG: hypothetical protein JW889_16210 [Verrucomicrobia bacterium]|nr:hypothetical protein [Verrucomicrobiota bacterium]
MGHNTTRYACLLGLALLFCLPVHTAVASGDTGTYKILDYSVKLTPRSDGAVEIAYYQKWSVTGGHIPWITVGTPNSTFLTVSGKNTGNVRSITHASSGDWSGVRIDLDKDYRPGETFEVGFSIVQNKLFWADKDSYHLDFTPGWYDRAETDRLRVEIFFFAKLDTVTAKPRPTRVEGQSMIWEKTALARGERFNLSVSFPRKLFPRGIGESQLRTRAATWPAVLVIVLLLGGFAALLVAIIVAGVRSRGTYGRGGDIYRGGSGGGSASRRVRTGGGGGFGGRSFSCACACACAGCACACACAGGGGAGCDRKLTYTCPLCKDCDMKDTCPLRKGVRAE